MGLAMIANKQPLALAVVYSTNLRMDVSLSHNEHSTSINKITHYFSTRITDYIKLKVLYNYIYKYIVL